MDDARKCTMADVLIADARIYRARSAWQGDDYWVRAQGPSGVDRLVTLSAGRTSLSSPRLFFSQHHALWQASPSFLIRQPFSNDYVLAFCFDFHELNMSFIGVFWVKEVFDFSGSTLDRRRCQWHGVLKVPARQAVSVL